MKSYLRWYVVPVLFCFLSLSFIWTPAAQAQSAAITGTLRQWHRVTLTFNGPAGSEATPATFRDYRLLVTFTNGSVSYRVPGYFAADGNAANTGATAGNKWRVHFTPPTTGAWRYSASFRTGNLIAIDLTPAAGTATSFNGATGTFNVAASNAPVTDYRHHGMLNYVGRHHLRFAGSGQYYLKAGADSPENFLGYDEFDGTYDTGGVVNNYLHSYTPHLAHYRAGDPTWAGGRGQAIIGAVNYLADQGVNSIYFLTYNIDGGDGADTWPWTDHNARDTFDVSKLDQWEIVFSHMTARGIQLHFITQETENDGVLGGGGDLNDIRKLYYREMMARFGHHPALQWNMGEENNNSTANQIDSADYFRALDPYNHPIAIHTNYNLVDQQYANLLGVPSFESSSIQGDATNYNDWAIEYRQRSAAAGRPWAIYGDEQGPAVAANMGNLDELRQGTLWTNLMGGGAGVEWYFGYGNNFGDLSSEDFTMAEPLWEDSAHAVDFFQTHLPFWRMNPNNALVSDGYALALPGAVYAAYFPDGGTQTLTLPDNKIYEVYWYNPRVGGALQRGSVTQVTGPGAQSLGAPPFDPTDDWTVLVRSTNIVVNPPPVAPAASSNNSGVAIFDPALSKIGILQPGQVGLLGERIQWVITVNNPTTVTGNNVVINDTLVNALQIDNVTTSAGTSTINGQTVSVTIPVLSPGMTVRIIIETTVLQSGITVENTACVDSDNAATECVTSLPLPTIFVTQLPATGESPRWRNAGLLLAVFLASVLAFPLLRKRQ